MSVIRRFINFNKKISKSFLEKHPLDIDIYNEYRKSVAEHIQNDYLIYDIGGGKKCQYIRETGKENIRIFAVDISAEELEENSTVDGKIVSDVCKEIPLPYGKVDMITSSSVLEHLLQPEQFFKNAAVSIKEGGYFIHVCPCRYACFAFINRILPHKLSRKILFFFKPENRKNGGFPAYYKKLYFSAIKKMLENQGFELVSYTLCFKQVDYFSFFFPLFLIYYGWDLMMKKLKLKDMAAYIMFVARKI